MACICLQGDKPQAQQTLTALLDKCSTTSALDTYLHSQSFPGSATPAVPSVAPQAHARALLMQARLLATHSTHNGFSSTLVAGSSSCLLQRQQSNAAASTSAVSGPTPAPGVGSRHGRSRVSKAAKGSKQASKPAAGGAQLGVAETSQTVEAMLQRQILLLLQAYRLSHSMPLLYR